jgi:hypothetical protein
LAYKEGFSLSLWDSQDTGNYYLVKDWPKQEFAVGKYNLKFTPLLNLDTVILPPLHIKLGLTKTFVKVLDNNGKSFK